MYSKYFKGVYIYIIFQIELYLFHIFLILGPGFHSTKFNTSLIVVFIFAYIFNIQSFNTKEIMKSWITIAKSID